MTILVVGPHAALLEGVVQTLTGAGQQVVIATDIPEAIETLAGARPMVALVHRDELLNNGAVFRLSLAEGGALLAFHTEDEESGLPFSLRRVTLAELNRPLERHRLLALVNFVGSRAEASGRDSIQRESSSDASMEIDGSAG
jgi:DNA-binding response OmpR family regulator